MDENPAIEAAILNVFYFDFVEGLRRRGQYDYAAKEAAREGHGRSGWLQKAYLRSCRRTYGHDVRIDHEGGSGGRRRPQRRARVPGQVPDGVLRSRTRSILRSQ